MITLMTYAGPAEDRSAATRTGGVPLVPAGFGWPGCAVCGGPMQFQAQVYLDDLGSPEGTAGGGGRGVLSIFMCQLDPGMCEDWNPEGGANRALLLPRDGLVPAEVPPVGAALRAEASRVAYVRVDSAGYEQARQSWGSADGRTRRDVLGQLGGVPAWLQGDETPSCPSCERPMGFVAQLEEGHDYDTATNFGGGSAYAFACEPCGRGSFRWQC